MRMLLASLVLLVATAAQSEELAALVERMQAEHGPTAVLAAVRAPDGTITSAAAGTSLPAEPASTAMRFRYGFPSITAITTILLQLAHEGVVALDDPVSKTHPQYPSADKITLEMLATSRAGYADFVDDEAFITKFYENPFYVFAPQEVLDIAFARGLKFEPGTGFHYSHANYIILAQILQEATGKTIGALAQERILSQIDAPTIAVARGAEITAPRLEAYTTERDVYENSTSWSPSWTSYTGLLNGAIEDLTRLFHTLATGATLTPEGLQQLIAEDLSQQNALGKGRYFAFGVPATENAFFAPFSYGGYEGIVSYNRETDTTIAVVTTFGPTSSPEARPSHLILSEIEQGL